MSQTLLRAAISTATDNTGMGALSIKVPGTFSAGSQLAGRYLLSMDVIIDSFEVGDYLSAIEVVDQDSIVPLPLQALFPNYPILQSVTDLEMDVDNQRMYFIDGKLHFDVFNGPVFIPAQMYIQATVQKASASVTSVYVNVSWIKLQ